MHLFVNVIVQLSYSATKSVAKVIVFVIPLFKMSKGERFKRTRPHCIKDDQGRLYFFSDIANEPELLEIQKPSFPKSSKTLEFLRENKLEILALDMAEKEYSKSVTDNFLTTKSDFNSYTDIVVNYNTQNLREIKEDIQENLFSHVPFRKHTTAWFCVRLNSTKHSVNLNQLDTNLPFPNSSSSEVTFLNGRVRAVCIAQTRTSKSKTALPVKMKTARVLLEFNRST